MAPTHQSSRSSRNSSRAEWWYSSDSPYRPRWLATDPRFEKARATTDEQQRRTLYGQAQRRLLETMPTIVAFEAAVPFVRQDYIAAPSLQDPKLSVAMQGGNWMFRTFSINK